jgi:hypothetical protein
MQKIKASFIRSECSSLCTYIIHGQFLTEKAHWSIVTQDFNFNEKKKRREIGILSQAKLLLQVYGMHEGMIVCLIGGKTY